MCQMPTGTGKTAVLSSIVQEHLNNVDSEHCVLVVAHRKEIIDQIIETLHNFGLSTEIQQGRIFVESIQKLNYNLKDDAAKFISKHPSLVVIDEAHHAQAKTYKELWNVWPKTKFLGMTATPCRLKKEGFTDLFDKLICAWNIKRFIMEGWLADYEYVAISQDSETKARIDSLKKRGIDGDYQVKEMGTVMDNRACIEQLYRSYKEYVNGRQGIIYAINREHAEHIRCYYKEQGESIMLIDSQTPKGQRDYLMQEYREGEIRIFVNCEIAGEGVDVPNVSFIQMARPTLSLSKYLQQVGRGLRPNPNKEKTIILDNVGMYYMFGLPNEDRDWQKMFMGGQVLPVQNTSNTTKPNHTKTKNADYDQGQNLDMIVIKKIQGSKSKVVIEKKYRGQCPEYVLTKNGKIIADNSFTNIYGFIDGVVRLCSAYDGHYFFYDDNGIFLYESPEKCEILPHQMLKAHDQWGLITYVDLLSGQKYKSMPNIWVCGNASFIEAKDGWHLRHREYSWVLVNRNDIQSDDRLTYFRDIIYDTKYLMTDAQIVMRVLGTEEDGSLVLANENNGKSIMMSFKNGSFSVYSNNKENKWIYDKWGNAFYEKPIARVFDFKSIIQEGDVMEIFKDGGLYGWKKGKNILCKARFKQVLCFSDSKYVLVTSENEPKKDIVVDISGNVVFDKHHIEKLQNNYAFYNEVENNVLKQYSIYLPEGYLSYTSNQEMKIEEFHFFRSFALGSDVLCYFPATLWGSGFYLSDIYVKDGVLHATHIKTQKEVVGFLDEPNQYFFLVSDKGNEWVLNQVTQFNLSGDAGFTFTKSVKF